MNLVNKIKNDILKSFYFLFSFKKEFLNNFQINLNLDKSKKDFGDLSCNGPLVLSKTLSNSPRNIAIKFKEEFDSGNILKNSKNFISSIDIAGPGFLNFKFKPEVWQHISKELFLQKSNFFKLDENQKKLKYLLEFVSANPTGPLHLGHGRGGVIGDVLSNVLNFLGHDAKTEFYINDAGNQMQNLGISFKVRCQQRLGKDVELPENAYKGEYLDKLAKICVKEYGNTLNQKDDSFFINYAKEKMLEMQKNDLADYGIKFDNWFSEKTLHESGAVEQAIEILKKKGLVYEKDGAWWFKAMQFGDDKDRVIKKATGEYTYLAADIAYHKNKFDRGFNKLINILGQDHHGYVQRLKGAIQALGYDSKKLDVILYQLVSITNAGHTERMSKRTGHFTTLREVIDTVGKDVARFFYLNRKADAHLDFDLNVALKKTEENPVFYIQYAYVRTKGILEKALEVKDLKDFVSKLIEGNLSTYEIDPFLVNIDEPEFDILKKIISLQDILNTISTSYQTHLLSYYMIELANFFHTYYANSRIVDADNIQLSKARLFILFLIRSSLGLGLELLGLSRLERM